MNGRGTDAALGRCAGRVPVRRGLAGGGTRIARGAGSPRRVAGRPGALGADREALAGRGRAAGSILNRPRAAEHPDVHLRAADGDQAAQRLGLRDAGQGGIGLPSPAPLLPDRDHRAGARGVDGTQAHPASRSRDGYGADPGADRQGGARAPLPGGRCPDRLNRGGGRRPLPLRRDALPAGSQSAGATGPSPRAADRRAWQRGTRPLAGGGAAGRRVRQARPAPSLAAPGRRASR
jgi:hypothetical protein